MRPERTGQTGRDFSAFLTQAMQSRDWVGAGGLQRQGLADLPPQALDRASHDAAGTESSTPAERQAADSLSARDEKPTTRNQPLANQELSQRALRNASLRAAQSRAEMGASGRTPHAESRARKANSRREEDAPAPTATGNPMALPPAATQRPVPEAADTSAQGASRIAAPSPWSVQDGAPPTDSTQEAATLGSQLPGQTPGVPGGQTPDGLTTVQLSPHMHIITSGQGAVNEQSLQAFAQSMGIDANQFKQLFSAAPNGSVDTAGLRAGVTATDALTGTPILPPPTDMTAIDLSQVLPAGLQLDELHIDWMGGRHGQDSTSLSTLDVLGMRDGGLGADAIASLQESADTGAQQGQHQDNAGGMGQSQLGAPARAGAAAANAATAPAQTSMTEHFEKLSAKLATEMAGRIHEQFSQGEWKMKFALKPASLGQVDVQLEMRDGKLAAVLQADNPMTQDLLQNGSQRLRDALSQMGLSQSSVSVGDGRSQAFQGDRQPGGQGMTSAHHQTGPDDSVQTVASAPRRNSLSQLDFYA